VIKLIHVSGFSSEHAKKLMGLHQVAEFGAFLWTTTQHQHQQKERRCGAITLFYMFSLCRRWAKRLFRKKCRGETVSSGRYMRETGRFMLNLVLVGRFLCCFVGAETTFFLGKNCFSGVVLVSFFAYHA
jgi:hypothetical protein